MRVIIAPSDPLRSAPDEAALVLARRHPHAASEVPVQVALVGEAGGDRRVAGALPRLEQAARRANAVGDLECVRRHPGPLAEDADEAELADARRRGELVEADVLRPSVA